MEYTPEKCKKTRKKNVNTFDDLFHICSECSLSSSSDSHISVFVLLSRKNRKRKGSQQTHQKHDYLPRLFERKKLKDKSLSKKIKTPFYRKLYRTCWPVELSRVSKIKKKPREKRKNKPNHKSLRRKKFLNPTFISKTTKFQEKSSSISFSESELDDESLSGLYQYYNNHFLYEPVTPQMLIDVLQEPEHMTSGATLDMIIEKLRALKLDLNPALDLLREEVIQKLHCAIKLGLVKENNGYYLIADNFRTSKLPRRKVNDFWELWYRKTTRIKQ